MKKTRKSLIVLALASVVVCGISLSVSNRNSGEVFATPHTANFDLYDYQNYSGTYYSFLDGQTLTEGLNGTLRTKLTENILPKDWYSYSGSGEKTLSAILQEADEDPTNSSNMIYLYTRDSVKKNAANTWNREHTWPKNLSGGCWGEGKAGADILHIRPTYPTPNSTRSNNKFAEISGGQKRTYEGKDFGYTSGSNFMPLDAVKGDVARVIMYVWVAYKNFYGNLPNITNVFESYNTMLKWHTEDKPDVMEAHRNDVSESSYQKNRNPFVDHPEYAWKIFGDSASSSVKEACKAAYPDSTTPTTKILNKIILEGEPIKKVYNSGENFDRSGITVTAIYDTEGSQVKKDITSIVTITPTPLTSGTTSVTFSYTDGGITKTTVYSGITVKENYGTLNNPLSVSQAKSLIENQCKTSGSYTQEQIYCTGKVGSNLSSDKTKFNIVDLNSASSVASIDSMSLTAEQKEKLASGDTIVFHGYGYKNGSTGQFKTKDSSPIILDRNISKEGNIPVTDVTINNDETDFLVGDDCDLETTIEPSYATNKSLTYISSNSNIATVDYKGHVSFVGEGSVTITATSVSNTSVSDSIVFKVTKEEPPVPVIKDVESITAPSSYEMLLDETRAIQYKVLPADATYKEIEWSTSDKKVVVVNDDGIMTAMGYGNAVITGKSLDEKATVSINVTVSRDKSFDDSVAKLHVEKYPVKTIYNVGEEFNDKGLVVVAHLTNGGKIDVTDNAKVVTPDTSTVGAKTVNVTYKQKYSVSFDIQVISNAITGINIEKNPLKTHYFDSEVFNPLGMVVMATLEQGDTIDVTNSVDINSDFTVDNVVDISLNNFHKTIEVEIESGEVTVEHRAVDFTYNFVADLGNVKTEDVKLEDWKSMEYYYNQLDDDAKGILNNTVASAKNGEVGAAEETSSKLKDCVTRYDEIYLAHKAEGFTDFMNRKPVDPNPKNNSNGLLILIGVCAGIVVITVLIIIICVSASKHKKRKALAKSR